VSNNVCAHIGADVFNVLLATWKIWFYGKVYC